MNFLRAFGAFWYDFIIGDDWKIAAYTVVALAVVALLGVNGFLSDAWITVAGVLLLCVFFVAGVVHDARTMSR